MKGVLRLLSALRVIGCVATHSFRGDDEVKIILSGELPRRKETRGKMPERDHVHRTVLTAAANACMFVFGVVLLLMGSLLPSLQVSYTQAGHLGSFPLAGILVAAILAGPILDSVGAKPVLALALVLIAVPLAVIPSLHSYPGLAGAALTYGLGGGLLNTVTNALVSDLNPSGRAAALNLLGFSLSLGAISAPLLMSIGDRLPSSVALRLLATGIAVILLPVLALHFPPAKRPGAPVNLRALNQGPLWLFGMLLFFESGSENCMFVWSSRIAADVLRTSPHRANLALVALSAAHGIGRLIAALWLHEVDGRTVIRLSTAATVAGALVVDASREFPYAVVGIGVIGLGFSTIFPTALGLAGDRFPGESGTVFGALIMVAAVGGMLGPTAGAWLAGNGPLKVLWIPVAAATAVATLTSVAPLQKE
jgi:MFS transporter, FHS family, glucose/mannose:H+ symporter